MKLNVICLILISLILSSCGRYKNWFLRTFPEDVYNCMDCSDATKYVKESAIYERWRTRGLFTVIWLNETVRHHYVCLLSQRKEYDCESRSEVWQKQLDALGNSVSFYVLFPKPIPDNTSDICECTEYSMSANLQVGDKNYKSTCIKKVDLEPEYIRLLSIRNGYLEEKTLKFRDPFLVTFTNVSDKIIDESGVDNIKLEICNGCYQTDFCWQL